MGLINPVSLLDQTLHLRVRIGLVFFNFYFEKQAPWCHHGRFSRNQPNLKRKGQPVSRPVGRVTLAEPQHSLHVGAQSRLCVRGLTLLLGLVFLNTL